MHRSRAYLALILSCALVFPCTIPAFAAGQDDLDAARQRAADARQAAEEAQSLADRLKTEVESLDDKIAGLEGEVGELDPQIAAAADRASRLRAEVESLRAQVAEKEADIAKTQADYELQQQLLGSRLATTYKQGSLFYLDLLLDSKTFSDLIARTTLVQRVIKSNHDIAQHLSATKQALEVRRTELDRDLQTVQTKRTEAELVEGNLRKMRSQRQQRLDEQESIQNQKSALMKESAENAERLRALAEEEERESARIEAELRANSSNGSGVYNGVMAWPVPGFYRIASPYGPRICPFHGQEVHSGIDIGRTLDPPQSIDGAAIVAAGDGSVIFTGYRSGYGNTVMIDHGNGVVTLYAHQRTGGITVSVGQEVVKGQRIGTVGSTGYSTGPHLHFEVRINGSPIDPMGYLK